MKTFHRISTILLSVSLFIPILGLDNALAANTPPLGLASTYAILGSTFTNTIAGTTVNGDIGFTTGPVVVPGGTHLNYGPGAPYAGAGTAQATALSTLSLEICTFTFAPGAIDLATDISHGSIGVYSPGVYCTAAASAASIGASGITLQGAGTYIFRISGALTTVINSTVTLNGASAHDVFWTPSAATTLGANSTFFGTVIDDAGITIGTTVTWVGRALAFAGTVTTDTDTISVPTTPAKLHIIKQVVGGTLLPSSFNLHVKAVGVDVALSPAAGTGSPGTPYSLAPGTYSVSEDSVANYTSSFSAGCGIAGSIVLAGGSDITCTITNTYVPPPVVSSGGGGGGSVQSRDVCPNGDYSSSYYDGNCGTAPIVTSTVIVNTGSMIVSVPAVIASTGTTIRPIVVHEVPNEEIFPVIDTTPNAPLHLMRTPTFPNTGLPPANESVPFWTLTLSVAALMLSPIGLILLNKKYMK